MTSLCMACKETRCVEAICFPTEKHHRVSSPCLRCGATYKLQPNTTKGGRIQQLLPWAKTVYESSCYWKLTGCLVSRESNSRLVSIKGKQTSERFWFESYCWCDAIIDRKLKKRSLDTLNAPLAFKALSWWSSAHVWLTAEQAGARRQNVNTLV